MTNEVEAPEPVRKPMAYAFVCRRNAAVDRWRKDRIAERLRKARGTHAALLRSWRRQREAQRTQTEAVIALARLCPWSGVDEYEAWLLTGDSPLSSDPGRAAWDKRVQRVRKWVLASLSEEAAEKLRPYMKHRLPPPKPTFRKAYLIVCQRLDPGVPKRDMMLSEG